VTSPIGRPNSATDRSPAGPNSATDRSPAGPNSATGRDSTIGRVVVLLGAPGAGKGTQAQILAERLGLAHVATGDLFRAAVRDGTPLGLVARGYMDRGELVPDSVTIEMLLERLARPDAAAGILLDGFPRSVPQAEVLDRALAERGGRVDVAPLIEVPEPELVARLGGRWICRAQGHPYHLQGKPPKRAGICDVDGSELYQRDDDKPETVKARLRQQLGTLDQVVDYYRDRGVLARVDGTTGIENVTTALLAAITPTIGPRGGVVA
jgi:adenylate kinase